MPYTVTIGQKISDAIGGKISRVGEVLGIERLIYNPLTFWNFHRVAKYSAPGVIRTFKQMFPDAKRYLDVGAGSGAYAAEATRSGINCIAIEYSATARKIAHKQNVDCRPFDLTQDPPANLPESPFDLAYSFEVAEHVPEPIGRKLVAFMARQAPIIAFSAGQPGQLGMGHINCQPREYWIARFAETGVRYRDDLTKQAIERFRAEDVAWWLVDNLMIFERAELISPAQ